MSRSCCPHRRTVGRARGHVGTGTKNKSTCLKQESRKVLKIKARQRRIKTAPTTHTAHWQIRKITCKSRSKKDTTREDFGPDTTLTALCWTWLLQIHTIIFVFSCACHTSSHHRCAASLLRLLVHTPTLLFSILIFSITPPPPLLLSVIPAFPLLRVLQNTAQP